MGTEDIKPGSDQWPSIRDASPEDLRQLVDEEMRLRREPFEPELASEVERARRLQDATRPEEREVELRLVKLLEDALTRCTLLEAELQDSRTQAGVSVAHARLVAASESEGLRAELRDERERREKAEAEFADLMRGNAPLSGFERLRGAGGVLRLQGADIYLDLRNCPPDERAGRMRLAAEWYEDEARREIVDYTEPTDPDFEVKP